MKEKILFTLVNFALKIIALLPYSVLYLFSSMIYPILYYVIRYRREVVHSNLINSFPEKSEKEIIEIEKNFYRHFCDYVMETLNSCTSPMMRSADACASPTASS